MRGGLAHGQHRLTLNEVDTSVNGWASEGCSRCDERPGAGALHDEGDLEEQDLEDEESGDSGIDELDGEQAADDMSVDEYDDEGYAPL